MMTQEKLQEYAAKIKQSIQRKHEIEARMDEELRAFAAKRNTANQVAI